jgi:hypothetical protein
LGAFINNLRTGQESAEGIPPDCPTAIELLGQPRTLKTKRAERLKIIQPFIRVPTRPAGLRPELVPSSEVVKVLSTAQALSILELENEAAINVQLLAVSLRCVVMNADDAAVVTYRHGLQYSFESSTRLASIPPELGKGGITAFVVASDAASTRRVPRGVLLEDLGERLHVARVEGLVASSDGLSVSFCVVHDGVLLGCDW